MRRLLLGLLFGASLAWGAGDVRVGIYAETNSTGYTSWYQPGVTLSYNAIRFDSDLYVGSLYYIWEFKPLWGIVPYLGGGVATFYYMTDTWMGKTPVGLSYKIAKFDIYGEYVPTFALVTSGKLAKLGYSDTIHAGLRYRF